MTAPVLHYPDFKKLFTVHIDKSLYAIGSILSQLDDERYEYLVGYYLRALTPQEKNYNITKKKVEEKHQNANRISRLLFICYFVDKAEKIYDPISKPELWETLPEEIQKTLKTLLKTLL